MGDASVPKLQAPPDAAPGDSGVKRPGPGTKTGRVWEIADELLKAGVTPTLKEVLGRGVSEGLDPATIQTQLGRWRRFHGRGRKRGASKDRASGTESRPSNQVVGNAGLFFVCYRLSLDGWNVMPTSRNARGIDVLAYSETGRRVITLQVKALSKEFPAPLGKSLDNLFANFLVVCRNVLSEHPECFVLTPEEVRQHVHVGVSKGGKSHWLQPKQYEQFSDWRRIGSGFDR